MVGTKNGAYQGRGFVLETDMTAAQQVMTANTTYNGIINVNGDPEGVETANPGTLGLDRTGNVYLKETGTGNTGWAQLSTGSGGTPTITTDDASVVNAVTNNFNVIGLGETLTESSGDPNVQIFSPRVAQYIVDPTTDNGTHTTIQSAVTAASAGDVIFVRPGTYTEDITGKADVVITSFAADSRQENVLIVGKISCSSGRFVVCGMAIETNGDYLAETTSSGGIEFRLCRFAISDFHGFNQTSSSDIACRNCLVNLSSATHKIGNVTAGSLVFRFCTGSNTSNSTAATTVSGGSLTCVQTEMPLVVSTSSSGEFNSRFSRHDNVGFNTALLTTAGTGVSTVEFSEIITGTDSAISIGSGTIVRCFGNVINSTNANNITGPGELVSSDTTFYNVNTINVSNQTNYLTTNDLVAVTQPSSWPHTAKPQDRVILVDSGTAARTVNLNASPRRGQRYTIKDEDGNAATNNITVTPASGNIDGAASYTMSVDYGSIDLVRGPSEWHVV